METPVTAPLTAVKDVVATPEAGGGAPADTLPAAARPRAVGAGAELPLTGTVTSDVFGLGLSVLLLGLLLVDLAGRCRAGSTLLRACSWARPGAFR